MQSIVFFPTNDLKATSAFYTSVLDLELALDQGSCLIFKVAQDAFIGFCEAADEVVPDQRVMVTIVDRDVDEWYERITRAGVRTDGAPRENVRYKIYHFFAEDPNGYKLEFQRFLDPRWNDYAADSD